MTDENTITIELAEYDAKTLQLLAADTADAEDDDHLRGIADELSEAIAADEGRLTFDEYQSATEETAVYPTGLIEPHGPDGSTTTSIDVGVLYTALGLNGEAGEVAERVKKDLRGDDDEPMDLGDEIGDVLWYLAQLSDQLGYSLESVARRNRNKLLDRDERDEIKGSGSDR